MAARVNGLLEERNQKMFDRYKELYNISFLRHDKVLDILSKEFYLGLQSIEKIIAKGRKKPLQKAQELAI